MKPSEETPQSLRSLESLALLTQRMNDGDVILVGWSADEVPGMRIYPESNQTEFHTLLVSHLRYGALPAPTSDINNQYIRAN
ncbi:MAG: hypothetical protein R3C28_05185 [Pirellulaceae bacterium]